MHLMIYSQKEKPDSTNVLIKDTIESNGRAMASPFANTPFPMAEWCGDPVIGTTLDEVPDFLKKPFKKPEKKPGLNGIKPA